jgi:predicted enzyme related to lactoylglutathione lyase
MANLVVHFEISATDPQQLIDFYSNLLGWTFTDYGTGGSQSYWIIDTGEGSINNRAGQGGMGINGGMVPRRGPRPEVGAPVMGSCLVIGVSDVDGLMAKGVALGGKEAMAAQDWPGVGRGGYLLDPDNNIFGLISPVMSDGTVAMGSGADAQ